MLELASSENSQPIFYEISHMLYLFINGSTVSDKLSTIIGLAISWLVAPEPPQRVLNGLNELLNVFKIIDTPLKCFILLLGQICLLPAAENDIYAGEGLREASIFYAQRLEGLEILLRWLKLNYRNRKIRDVSDAKLLEQFIRQTLMLSESNYDYEQLGCRRKVKSLTIDIYILTFLFWCIVSLCYIRIFKRLYTE